MVRAAFLFVALTMAPSAGARAQGASAVMEVRLVVQPSCQVSATPLSFSGQAGQPIDAASEIRVACNDDTPVAVRLDGGLNGDGLNRRLVGDGGEVPYTIYSDPRRSHPWAAGEARAGTAGIAALTLAAYGRIEADATLGALGGYTDSITVTVDF